MRFFNGLAVAAAGIAAVELCARLLGGAGDRGSPPPVEARATDAPAARGSVAERPAVQPSAAQRAELPAGARSLSFATPPPRAAAGEDRGAISAASPPEAPPPAEPRPAADPLAAVLAEPAPAPAPEPIPASEARPADAVAAAMAAATGLGEMFRALGDVELLFDVDPRISAGALRDWLRDSGSGLVSLECTVVEGRPTIRRVELPGADGLPSRVPTDEAGFEAFVRSHATSERVWIELADTGFDRLVDRRAAKLLLVLGAGPTDEIRRAAAATGAQRLRAALEMDGAGPPRLAVSAERVEDPAPER